MLLNYRRMIKIAIVLVPILAAFVFGEEDGSQTKVNGWTWWETGKLVKAKHFGKDYTQTWLHDAFVNITVTKTIDEHLSLHAGVEGQMWFNSFDMSKNRFPDFVPGKNYSFYLTQAEGIYTIGNPEKASLLAELGIFRFKYNPQSRNLGEYLFRSCAYPGYLVTNFDFPVAQLSGLHLANTLFTNLHQDLLLTMETDMPPYFDWTATYIAGYTAGAFGEIGLGIQLSHFLSVNSKLTTPKKPSNSYPINERTLPDGSTVADSGYYTFRGTKLMGRIMVDPKALFSVDWLGKEDLRLYAEAAILGLKNYPVYYDTLWQRIPIMFGFNIPAFKTLDVFSLEFEWYGNRYPNSFENVVKLNQYIPIPAMPLGDYATYNYNKDNWKWSVYAKKTILKNVTFVAQAARDHLFTRSAMAYYSDREEALTKISHWYWMTKVLYNF